MKAAIRRSYGPPEKIRIEEIETPVPKENEVLIKVFATTVNRTDCANLTAKPFIMRFVVGLFKPKRIILGNDFAGQVVAVGSHVKKFQLNDRVFGFKDTGLSSQAEFVVLNENDNLIPIPEGIDYKHAVASLEGAHYAYTFIHKPKISSGQRILINGATGAIGSAALQLVKQFDVHVTATCNTKNIELIQNLGADKIYDYTKEDFTSGIEKYDFILDTVGKSSFGKCIPILNKGGTYISSELGAFAQNVFFALFTKIAGSKKVIFPIPSNPKITMPYISECLQKGIFKPVIDREYPLEKIASAFEYVMSGQKTGNVIIVL